MNCSRTEIVGNRGMRLLDGGTTTVSGELRENILDHSIATDAHERKRILGVGAHPGEKPGAHHSMPAVQTDLHIFFREAQSIRGFGGAQLFDVSQHEHRAILLWKIENRLFQQLAEFRSSGYLFRVGRSFNHICSGAIASFGILQLIESAPFAKAEQSLIHRDPGEPCREWCATLKLAKVLVGVNISGLHDVFRFGVIADNGPRDTVEALVVAAHDDFVQGGLSRPHPLNDLFVSPPFNSRPIEDPRAFHGSPTLKELPRWKRLQAMFP